MVQEGCHNALLKIHEDQPIEINDILNPDKMYSLLDVLGGSSCLNILVEVGAHHSLLGVW